MAHTGSYADDNFIHLVRLHTFERRRELSRAHSFRLTRFVLFLRLSDAQDGRHVAIDHLSRLEASRLIRLAKEPPSLRVSDENVRTPDALRHLRAHLTRVRAARFVVDVLRADGDARAFELRFRKVQPVSRSLSHLAVTSRKRVKDDESV